MTETKGVFLIVLLVACTLAAEVDPDYSYDDFMRQFKRTYEGEEKAKHEKIFKEKYAELLALRAQGRDVVVNQFLDWTQEQRDSYLNFQPQKMKLPLSSGPLKSSLLFAAPSSFDWRTYDRVTDVKDQGGCGSCYDFAATAQYESLLAIATNGTKYDLSEQYGLQCDTGSGRCNGGFPLSTLNLFKNGNGIPLQTTYPYNISKNYTDICTDTANRVKINQTISNTYYYAGISAEQLQQDLVAYGPITVGVRADDSNFLSAGNSGLISCGAVNSVNHAILLVGYNTTHWFIKNSWGTWWGNNGYGYINKSADCNIRTYINQMVVDYGFSPFPNPDPNPTPNPSETLNLTIYMSDYYGDGWTGNILAIKQNGVIVGTFGETFTDGGATSPVYITVQGNVFAQVVVSQLGWYSEEVDFIIVAPNGTYIYHRKNAGGYGANKIFTTFCPIGSCPVDPNVTYYVTMTDDWGDGWNGNILAFKQNGVVVSTFTLDWGWQSSAPVSYTFAKFSAVTITVSVVGQYTQEVGFVVRNAAGAIVYQKHSGSYFYGDTIIGTFCPECLNLSPVAIVGGAPLKRDQASETTVVNEDQGRGYLISTYVLASVLLLTGIALAFTVYKYVKLSRKVSTDSGQRIEHENNPTGKSISSSVEVMKNI